ncbi:DUF4349 domain-containing protein [Virgibacillus dokdonensis]|uniref:DUF4349 domain-containing protein n=1 Tax=Virgibacillus dokdonensis TaxID=302167 RepID=A0A2K9J8D3_9BACI|nr:DUF4349 domain-containing protein [Virgibacillus dokdonensis]AUJ27001.1 hypothetical protein A21D_03967 [Virgibacillus dokdonensis]
MRSRLFLLLCFFLILLTSCDERSDSSDQSNSLSSNQDDKTTIQTEDSREMADSGKEQTEQKAEETEVPKADTYDVDQRKVIYTADTRIEVKDLQKKIATLESLIIDYNGYIVESSRSNDTEEKNSTGFITARVPQTNFKTFMDEVESGEGKLLSNNISGQDVTEEYVDLESRLQSKKVVEKRLLAFMEQAEKTEDLLAISEDLAEVQEEIEQITGRMNYLQNKADLATVHIEIQENNVSLEDGDLNTWEATKQQFIKSINFLLKVISNVFVFIAGNMPVLILISVLGWLGWIFIRKWVKQNHKEK